jgi:hypothetical protein
VLEVDHVFHRRCQTNLASLIIITKGVQAVHLDEEFTRFKTELGLFHEFEFKNRHTAEPRRQSGPPMATSIKVSVWVVQVPVMIPVKIPEPTSKKTGLTQSERINYEFNRCLFIDFRNQSF